MLDETVGKVFALAQDETQMKPALGHPSGILIEMQAQADCMLG